MPVLYSTGPIANAPVQELDPAVRIELLNNDVRVTSRVVVTWFEITGAKSILNTRFLNLAPLTGRNVVFEFAGRVIRSYEVQILVDGAEENLMASVWKRSVNPAGGGLLFAPEKRALHSELVSRFVPFVPIIPLPPIIGATATAAEGEGAEEQDEDGSSGTEDEG